MHGGRALFQGLPQRLAERPDAGHRGPQHGRQQVRPTVRCPVLGKLAVDPGTSDPPRHCGRWQFPSTRPPVVAGASGGGSPVSAREKSSIGVGAEIGRSCTFTSPTEHAGAPQKVPNARHRTIPLRRRRAPVDGEATLPQGIDAVKSRTATSGWEASSELGQNQRQRSGSLFSRIRRDTPDGNPFSRRPPRKQSSRASPPSRPPGWVGRDSYRPRVCAAGRHCLRPLCQETARRASGCSRTISAAQWESCRSEMACCGHAVARLCHPHDGQPGDLAGSIGRGDRPALS
jgi:hypothetical protein